MNKYGIVGVLMLTMALIPSAMAFASSEDDYFVNDPALDEFILNNPTDSEPMGSKAELLQKVINDIKLTPKSDHVYQTYADQMHKNGKSGFSVFVSGNAVDFTKYDNVLPALDNGRTLVPLRALVEALNASVSWDSGSMEITIVKGNKTVVLKIDSDIAYVDGEKMILDAPARLSSGRTMIPLRFVGEAFGEAVGWFTSGDVKVISVHE